jgi:hypothetical protein
MLACDADFGVEYGVPAQLADYGTELDGFGSGTKNKEDVFHQDVQAATRGRKTPEIRIMPC